MQDTDHPATLQEFIDSLGYGNTASIMIEDVSHQFQLLDYFILLLKDKPEDLRLHPAFFLFPGVEEFFARLFVSLDQSLKPKVEEVFQQGWAYISGFVDCPNIRPVIHRLLAKLTERFPHLKELYDEQFKKLTTEFFQQTIGKFLDAHKVAVGDIATKFPAVYELFITPLTALNYQNHKLFSFYCNPWIYSPIVSYLAKQDQPQFLSEEYGKRIEEPIRWLEERLQMIRAQANEESWQELTRKAHDLCKASNALEPFANQSSGLLGEIKTAFTLTQNECDSCDLLIFLEDDNRKGKKKKLPNCDLMIIRHKEKDRILIEVATKSPRHGVEDDEAKTWDDFFSNFSSAICSYLQYLERIIPSILGLNLRKCFPLFSAYEGSNYGTALPLVYQDLVDQSANSDPVNKWKSERKLEHLLRILFLQPLVLETVCAPLASDNVRLKQRCQATERALQKEWVLNIIEDKVCQLLEAYKRQETEGHKISKLYVALDLSLSYRLLQDPFSYHDGNVQDIAIEKLHEIFQPFKDEFSINGLDLELLLI